MVQRYLFQGGFVAPCDEGHWVLYNDYVKLEAELQKYKDQFPDYVECANCGSVTDVEGVEDAVGQSGCRKEDTQEWPYRFYYVVTDGSAPFGTKVCKTCGVKE